MGQASDGFEMVLGQQDWNTPCKTMITNDMHNSEMIGYVFG